MGLFIAQTDGTTNFDVGQVEVDTLLIALKDIGIGWTETPTTDVDGVTCVQVTYAQTEFGTTADRLNDLINNVSFAAPPDIVIFAVDDSFTLSDGTPMVGNGQALWVGKANNPLANNISAFYDSTLCGGQGVWVDKDGGGTVCNTPEVVLYHELSHCFVLSTGAFDPNDPAADFPAEEVRAEGDENDMRDVSGVEHRDVNSHNGGCGAADSCFGASGGGGGCCIVATLATGSALSDEVMKFRHLREHILRRSEVGDDFFKHFFYHYYAFSPEVTHLIGSKPNLSPLIKDRFVMPLLCGVELLVFYAEHKGKGLATFLRGQSGRDGLSSLHQKDFLDMLSAYLSIARGYDEKVMTQMISLDSDTLGEIPNLLRYINRETMDNEFIKWPLIDVVEVWVMSALLLHSDRTDAEIDQEIYHMISAWIGYMPVTFVWEDFSRLQTEMELDHLEQFVFDPVSKQIFANRLEAEHPKYSSTIRKWAGKRRDA